MFIPTTIADQYQQAASDNLRILVVGAGIAGITAAQLLRRACTVPCSSNAPRTESTPATCWP